MRTLSNDYLAAAKAAGRYPNVKATIADVGTINGDNEITELHITRGTTAKPEYYDNMLAVSAECRITVDRRRISDESGIVSGKQVQVYAAFNNPDGTEIASALIGTFFITSYDTKDDVYGQLIAADAMIYTEVDFDPEQLAYPATLSEIMTEAFRQSGITLAEEIELDIDPSVYAPPYKAEQPIAEGMEGAPYTCREVLARIAAMNMGAMFIAADGTPTIEGYGNVNTDAINNAMIYGVQKGSETFYIDQVRVFSSEERMAKKRTSYLKLPYAPRFAAMGSPKSGTDWHDEIVAKAAHVCDKPWTTATVEMQGVGEVEIGDLVQAAGVVLHVSGITYDFAHAHFTETLCSFAWTLEEYLKTHPPIQNAAGTQNIPKTIYAAADPALDAANAIKLGDSWGMVSASAKALSTMYKRVKNKTTGEEEWQEDYNIASGGSGGVGRNVGRHNEVFNINSDEAQNNTITTQYGDYNTARGQNNTISGDSVYYNDAGGSSNTISGNAANACRIGGESNTLTGYNYSAEMNGYHNTAAERVYYSYISGQRNQILDELHDSIVVGYANVFPPDEDGAQESIIFGQQNSIADVRRSAVGGTGNRVVDAVDAVVVAQRTVSRIAMYSFLTGSSYSVDTANNSVICGSGHNILNVMNAVVCGVGATDASGKYIVAGTVFHVTSSGAVAAAGGYSAIGADYAEMFEWADGNPENEDRRGMLVSLSGNRIIPAHGDDFIGIISANPSVIGNNPLHWHGKYKTDVFGSVIYDDNGDAVLSEEYDPKREYIPRSERPEWAAVGLTGRLVVVDDGSCVPDAFVSVRHGRATKCYKNTGARVLKRIDKTHVEVLLK